MFLCFKVNKIHKNLALFNENILALSKKIDELNTQLDDVVNKANLENLGESFFTEPIKFTPVDIPEISLEDHNISNNCEPLVDDSIPKDLTSLVKQASFYVPEFSKASSNEESSKTISDKNEVKLTNTLAIRTKELLGRIWQWFIVGDDYASKDIPREYAVAITWLLRFAVILIVFGIGYFIKYSHDNNLFPPQLRLLTSGVVTMTLIALGCYLFRTSYRIFGAALGGAGFIGLYLTIFAGVGLYKVISPFHGLIMLIIVTFSGVVLSLTFNYMFLGILAICGGFLAPVLINTGSRNLTGLFVYMIILALGSAGVSRFRNWPILNILSFIFVWIIFIMAEPFNSLKGDYPYSLTLLFGTIFFLIFTLQNSFFNTCLKKKCTLVEVGLELLNCIIFTSISLGYYPEQNYPEKLSALIPLGVAIVLFIQLFLLIYKKVQDPAFKLTIMVLICGFLTLTIPLALEAKYVTFFWAILALSILYIACRTSTKALSYLGCILYFITGLTLMSGFLYEIYCSTVLDRIINFGGFALSLVMGYKCLVAYPIFDLSNETLDNKHTKSNIIMQVFLFASLVFTYVLLTLETSLLDKYNNESCYIARSLILAIFICFFAWFKKRKLFTGQWTNIVVLFVTYGYVIYLLNKFDFTYTSLAGFGKLLGLLPATVFLVMASWLWRTSVNFITEDQVDEEPVLENTVTKNTVVANILLSTSLAVWFYYSSREVANLEVFKGNSIAVSLLWIVYSITLLFIGIKKNIKVIRYISLILFAISIIKIFFKDLSSTLVIYRIIGCIVTGIILTLGAWLYAKNSEKFKAENQDK